MRSIVITGQKVEGPCESCGKFVESTWGYHPFHLEDGSEVEDVMQATCDTCGSVTAIAGQATHRIKGAVQDKARHRTRVRIQRELVDLMGHRLNMAGADPTDYEMFARAVFVAVHEREREVMKKLRGVQDPVLARPADAGINVTIGTRVGELVERLKAATNLSTSEVLRRLLVLSDGWLSAPVDAHLGREAYVTA